MHKPWDTTKAFSCLLWAIDHAELRAMPKLLLIYLARKADRDGSNAFPSINTMARATGMHRSTVKRALKELEDKGYIRRTGGVGTGRRAVTRWAISAPTTPGADDKPRDEPAGANRVRENHAEVHDRPRVTHDEGHSEPLGRSGEDLHLDRDRKEDLTTPEGERGAAHLSGWTRPASPRLSGQDEKDMDRVRDFFIKARRLDALGAREGEAFRRAYSVHGAALITQAINNMLPFGPVASLGDVKKRISRDNSDRIRGAKQPSSPTLRILN